MFGMELKTKAINGGKENDYGKDYMKIKFNSDDDLPSKKPLKFHAMTIIFRCVFEEGGKLYLQDFFRCCINKCIKRMYTLLLLVF